MPSPETWKKAEELLPAEHVALLKKIDADLENLARENHNLKMDSIAMQKRIDELERRLMR